MKIYKIETENIYFAGDLHGEFPTINVTINRFNLDNCAIVVCGDIGIGFEKEEYYIQTFNHLTKTLAKKNIHLFLFRGNHDNKDYFDGKHFTQFEYIHVIPDYSVISSTTRNILCVGGATSIDRVWRKENMESLTVQYMKHHSCGWEEAEKKSKKLYWENEPIMYDIDELDHLIENNILVDTVCTHTAPSFCNPITKKGLHSWLCADPKLGEDLDKERKTCDEILSYLKENEHPLENWYYGHFHSHNVEIIDNIKYTLLDMSRDKMDLK
jgi:predicted phosphodiesterase